MGSTSFYGCKCGTGQRPAAVVGSPAEAKGHVGESQPVSLTGMVVTAGNDVLSSGQFYIEDPTRTSGILAVSSTGVTLGNVVNVTGTVTTNGLGETEISATTVQVVSSGEAIILAPYFMTLKALGGGTLFSIPTNTPGVTKGTGANNLGLLVKVLGRVESVAGKTFYIEDYSLGSNTVEVVCPSNVTPPQTIGELVTVTGISSCDNSSGSVLRKVLVRNTSDIQEIVP